MTNEELICTAKSGDKEALNQLFIQNKRLTYSVANKYKACGIDLEELISLCNLAMLKAYNSYDINHKSQSKFSTYATLYMNNEILRTIRDMKLPKNTATLVSLSEIKCHSNDGDDITYGEFFVDDKILTPEKQYEIKEDLNTLKRAMDKLSDREKVIITLFYLDNLRQDEIGNKLNLSRANVSRILIQGLRKLRKTYNKTKF